VFISDALVYMLSKEDLLGAFMTGYQLLEAGGVLVTYLEAFRDRPEMNTVRHSTNQLNSLIVTHIEHYCDPDPLDNIYTMTFFNVICQGDHLSVEIDRHLGGLFTVNTYRTLLIQVGLEVTETIFKTYDVPMFVCVKKGKER
jgi:hypothetical protein